jgi:hypothetical protein
MAFDDSRIKKGNISNYESASDDFLKKRLEEIRVGIRDPHLSVPEFMQGVVSQAGWTAVAAGWTAWEGLKRGITWLVSNNNWFAERLTVDSGKISFMKDDTKYAETLQKVSRNIADFVCKQNGMTADKLLNILIEEPKALGHVGSVERLTELSKEFQTLSEEAKETRLLDVLKEIEGRNRQAHVGQYSKIWTKILEIKKDIPSLPSSRMADDAFFTLKNTILESGTHDNLRIINKYRIPAVVALVSGAALFSGNRAYHATAKQKMLDLESEATYIERIMRERQQAAEVKDSKTEAPTPETKTSEKTESPKKSDSHLERLEASRELRDLETSPALG